MGWGKDRARWPDGLTDQELLDTYSDTLAIGIQHLCSALLMLPVFFSGWCYMNGLRPRS